MAHHKGSKRRRPRLTPFEIAMVSLAALVTVVVLLAYYAT